MHTIDGNDARIEYERETRKDSDIEFEPISSEDEDYESAPPDYQISTYPADFTLEVLHQKWKGGEIVIPEFQRRFVWKQVQSSKLIESFLVGLPVPPVFLYTDRKSQKFLVIDGQQRLKSIFYYFDGYFGPESLDGTRKVFRLGGLSNESIYSGKTYDDLREEDQRKLKNSVLRAFVVQQLDPADDTGMYHIFERLNTGGTLLTNQEIRNCVYHGKLISFLNEINIYPKWRRILGKDAPDSRKKDVELLIRFFALRDGSSYRRPMKDFLSKFMRKNRDASEEVFETSKVIFERTCNSVIASLGEKPFHVRAGLNAAVFDAVMVSFSKHLDNIPKDIKNRYDDLIKDKGFDSAIRNSTTNEETVKERFSKAELILFG